MRWDHPESIRVDIICYSGINFSGRRKIVRFVAKGGRQGPEILPEDIQSVAVGGPLRTRVTFIGTELEKGWEESHSWRAVEITKEHSFKTKDGVIAVQLPDIVWYHKPNAKRSDPDFEESYPYSDGLDDRTSWTYGSSRGGFLKGGVHAIKIERLPKDED